MNILKAYEILYISYFYHLRKGFNLVWFGSVLWHINYCRLFNPKSFLYICIKYITYKHIFVDNILKWAWTHFLCSLLNGFTYSSLKRIILFIINHLFAHKSFQILLCTRIIKQVSRLFSYGYFYWLYTHETLVPFEVISSGFNALVIPFQQLLEGPMEVLLCERVNDLRHSLFYLLNCLIMTV